MKITWVQGDKSPVFKDALWVREEVFTKEQGFPAEIDYDEMDQTAWQLVLYDEKSERQESSKAIGTLRFFLNEAGEYQIGRVAVLKDYRGQKLGKLLLKEALKKCGVLAKSDTVILHAQIAAKGLYEAFDFKCVGETFLEEGEPHILMKRSLVLGKIPAELLDRSKKILFIAHLAIGDFTYLQNCFKAFKEAYPHLKMDLFIEEVRCTSDAKKWPFLKKYSLYDWAETCDFFNKVYRENYSPALRAASIQEAKLENYPIVVSIETLASLNGAGLAREIAGDKGFAAGMDIRYKWYQLAQKRDLKNLDALIEVVKPYQGKARHISDDYSYWFAQIGGVQMFKEDQYPFVNIPEKWQVHAKAQLESFGVKADQPIVFINHIAKNPRRSWKLDQVRELIELMQALPKWQDTFFIINGIPEIFPEIENLIKTHQLKNTKPFSALDNFFELPAMLKESDLIISVETAVMHLANAVHVPVIALMRIKTLEWVPLNSELTTLIFTPKRADVIADIPASRVIENLPENPKKG
ncbi:GNAT family N-acetyltransferase [Ignatzschineria rhizosphaerae]|uniref:GNAT family N-acetyltransferase n=1 Tax=Ignatzschineria rhizosphaerae TaxID=2923279 RepID=A0ABY3X8R1_9GAMM|nr:GNAT family N-acetyltransferase [Ignatzschineria rhizosphaerae]UNM97447.1 GNAT family N-acetyltransferase [Ignatzschineria rhizosphaerae]